MNVLYDKILNFKYLPRILKILIIIGINWTFQSLLYMDKTEKTFKLLLDLLFFLVFFFTLKLFLDIFTAIVVAIVVAHTLNWIFNGHVFALLKTFGNIKTAHDKFIFYGDSLKESSTKESSILLVASFGSISRKEVKETSDLDIRIIRKKGFINALRSSFFVLLERSKAFFNKFPLDIYLCDNMNCIKNLKEPPVPIYDPDQLLKEF